jgi:P4 family phage/plasmid primase-like protien
MEICDFCDKHGIRYFGIDLKVGKGKKIPQYSPVYKSVPKMTDFKDLSEKVLNERKEYAHLFTYIAIDTSKIKHIDVDFLDDKTYDNDTEEFVEHYKSRSAYFCSMTKMKGKHILFTSDFNFDNNKRPQTNMEDIEILNGQWSFVKRTEKVYNADKLFHIDDDECEYFYKKLDTNTVSKITQSIPSAKDIKSAIEKPETDDTHQMYLLELVEIMKMEYIDDYDSWTRIVWSLHNDTESNNYEIARYMSAKSTKYDENEFNKLWRNTKTGISIGTFIHFARISNEKEFFHIRGYYCIFDNDDIGHLELDNAKTFLSVSRHNYVLKRGNPTSDLYTYHNGRWIQEDGKRGILKINIYNDLSRVYQQFINHLKRKLTTVTLLNNVEDNGDHYKEKETLEKKIANSQQYMSMFKNSTMLSKIAECVIYLLSCENFDDVEFDMKGHLLAFRNKVFDLKTLNFVETKREDYILTTTGYDFEECDDKKVAELQKLFEMVFPDPDIRKYYIHIMATGLYGVSVENMFIANGSGGNGKGVLNELMEVMLGNYAYTGSNSILLNPIKEGNCPALAGMKNKRWIVFREPDEKSRICLSTVKEITGGSKINARMNYSNDTNTTLCGTYVLECNAKPDIDGRLDESALRRIRDIPFVSTFTDNPEYLAKIDVLENVYAANKFYKSAEFREGYKSALFRILIDYIDYYHKTYGVGVCEKVLTPDIINERSREYLKSTDEIREWFDTVYESVNTDGKTKKDILDNKLYVSMKDVYSLFIASDFYENLSKKDRRRWTKKYLIEYVSTNINFKLFYSSLLKSGDKKANNVLIGFKELEEEEEEGECLI